MEEPVGDHQQHDDRDQSGGRLNVQRPCRDAADQPRGEEPGHDGRGEADPHADTDRPPQTAIRSEHAGGDRRQHEHRLESLAEDEKAAVERGGAPGKVPGGRIGDTAVDRLEHEDEEQDSGQGEQHPAMSLRKGHRYLADP